MPERQKQEAEEKRILRAKEAEDKILLREKEAAEKQFSREKQGTTKKTMIIIVNLNNLLLCA